MFYATETTYVVKLITTIEDTKRNYSTKYIVNRFVWPSLSGLCLYSGRSTLNFILSDC